MIFHVTKAADTNVMVRQSRIAVLDKIRGAAVVAMVCYHLAFDLKFLLGVDIFLSQPTAWLIGSRVITFTFMLCVGASLYLSGASGVHFWKRQARLGLTAVLVSACTFFTVRDYWVYFGVLHCIFFASLLLIPLARRPAVSGIFGIVIIAAWWAGVLAELPPRLTESTLDYAPIIPWLGAAMLGVPFGAILSQHSDWGNDGISVLSWLGRHALIIYIVHQPILVPLVMLLRLILQIDQSEP